MSDFLSQLFHAAGTWFLQLEGAAKSVTETPGHISFAIMFFVFYALVAFCSLGLVMLSAKMRGFFRGMAFAGVAACICIAGVTAGLSLALDSCPKVVVGPKPAAMPSMSGADSVKKAIEAARLEAEKLEENKKAVETKSERRMPGVDENGYPLRDDLSHENYYPQKNE